MPSEAEEIRRIRKRVETMNPPSVGCGVFVGLWLFLASLLILRGCFGVDALWPFRAPQSPAETAPATSAGTPAEASPSEPLTSDPQG